MLSKTESKCHMTICVCVPPPSCEGWALFLPIRDQPGPLKYRYEEVFHPGDADWFWTLPMIWNTSPVCSEHHLSCSNAFCEPHLIISVSVSRLGSMGSSSLFAWSYFAFECSVGSHLHDNESVHKTARLLIWVDTPATHGRRGKTSSLQGLTLI